MDESDSRLDYHRTECILLRQTQKYHILTYKHEFSLWLLISLYQYPATLFGMYSIVTLRCFHTLTLSILYKIYDPLNNQYESSLVFQANHKTAKFYRQLKCTVNILSTSILSLLSSLFSNSCAIYHYLSLTHCKRSFELCISFLVFSLFFYQHSIRRRKLSLKLESNSKSSGCTQWKLDTHTNSTSNIQLNNRVGVNYSV